MSDTPNRDELLSLAKKLVALLEAPEPGLITWHDAVHRNIDRIADFHKDKKESQG